MTFTLPKNIEQFNIKDVTIAGDECILVTPKDMGVHWDDENKYFRSSIWRKADMHPISLGFKKFVNLGEKPEFEPINEFTDLEFIRKMDGSLLIVSQYKGQLIIRTRGTVDASVLDNGYEIELLKAKYPKAFDNIWLKSEYHTLLFEWTTPSNRIVLQESNEPCLWLIGIVCHRAEMMDPYKFSINVKLKDAYHYFTQFELNQQSEYLGVPRPERYELNLENVSFYLKDKSNMEGVVVYSNDGQTLKKIKTPRYLYMHKVFTGIKSLKNILELWKEYGYTFRENFEAQLAINYDWELVVALKDLLDELFEKWKVIQMKLDDMGKFILLQNSHLDRKEIAQKILTRYGKWSSIAFDVLDRKQGRFEKMFEILDNDN